jgi:poly(3-hydroxybutyrate) depolymerase
MQSADRQQSARDDFVSKLRTVLPAYDAARIERMLCEKGRLEIPEPRRRPAADLIIPTDTVLGKTQQYALSNGRKFDVFIPRVLHTYREDGELRVPSIVALHGVVREAAAEKYHMKEQSGLNQVAERHGIIVIYPRAAVWHNRILPSLLGWSAAGRENILSRDQQINDCEEISKMRQYVADNLVPLGRKSGFIGHSDGGRMAQSYAVERPQDVAYLVPWASTWMCNDRSPGTGVPTRIILNEADETLPLRGGAGKISRWGTLLLGTNLADSRPLMMGDKWFAANRCSLPAEVIKEGKVSRHIYRGGSHALEVDICHGASHSIADWHSMGGTPNSPADTSMNMTSEVVKDMLPYLTFEHGR